MKHDEFMLKVLHDAANLSLPEQMGPGYTLEELALCVEMLNEDLLDGEPVEDETGRTCTILRAKITLKGREYLRQNTEDTPIKKWGKTPPLAARNSRASDYSVVDESMGTELTMRRNTINPETSQAQKGSNPES